MTQGNHWMRLISLRRAANKNFLVVTQGTALCKQKKRCGMWVDAWRLDVLVGFALVGGIAVMVLTGLAGLGLWFWAVERIRAKPNKKSLRELKRQWHAVAVEDR